MITATQSPEVYKTIIAPHPESIPNLTGWKRPRYAYVLMEMPQININHTGPATMTKGLYTVNAEGRPEIMNTIELAIREGGRIIDYGNFPKLNDTNAERAEKARNYSGGGSNPWDELERYVVISMGTSKESQAKEEELKGEIDALKSKLAEKIVAKETKDSVAVVREAKEK